MYRLIVINIMESNNKRLIFLESVKALYLAVETKPVNVMFEDKTLSITKEDVRLFLAVTALDLIDTNGIMVYELANFLNRDK